MNTLKRIILILLPLAALGVVIAGVLFFTNRMPGELVKRIESPLWSKPAIVTQGRGFVITLRCKRKPAVDKALLRNTDFSDALEYPLKVQSVSFDAGAGLARVRVQTPRVLPEYLYDLSIDYNEGIDFYNDFQPASVKVQRARRGTFTFAALSRFSFHKDLENPAARRTRINGIIDELNVLNPDFIVVTGGVANDSWTANRDSRELRDIFDKRLRVPVFILPNENDIGLFLVAGRVVRDGPRAWGILFGESRFRFDYEGFRFIGLNSYSCNKSKRGVFKSRRRIGGCVGAAELDWLEAELKDTADRRLQPVLFLHHNPAQEQWTSDQGLKRRVFYKKSREQMLELCRKYKVRAVFSSYMGENSETEIDGTLFVTTGQGGAREKQKPAFRLINVVEGRLQPRAVSYLKSPDSIPLNSVSVDMRRKNDGTAKENVVTVTNRLRRPLNNVLVPLKMARREDNNEYKIEGDAAAVQTFGRAEQFVFLYMDVPPGKKQKIVVK